MRKVQTTKQFLINCIEQARGDNLARCKSAFKDFTPEQMKEEHGKSGRTRRDIFDTHWNHDKDCNQAITAVKLHIPY